MSIFNIDIFDIQKFEPKASKTTLYRRLQEIRKECKLPNAKHITFFHVAQRYDLPPCVVFSYLTNIDQFKSILFKYDQNSSTDFSVAL